MASRKLSCRSKNLKLQNIVENLPSHCTLTSKRTSVAMCDEWNDGSEPPDKRRKTEPMEDNELWGDDEEDDVIFSQMVMDNIETSESMKTTTTREPNNNRDHRGIDKKPTSIKSADQNDKKGSKFYYPKSIPSDISQQLKSQGYGTMTHISASTLPGSLQPSTAKQKSSASQMTGLDQQQNSVVTDTSPSVAKSLQKGCKTDSSLFNSTLTKFPPAPHQKADFAEIMQLKIQKLEEENGFLRQDNQKLKESQYGRDGQIKMLRTKVTQLEAERSRDKQEKMKQKEQQTKTHSEKEKKLETDVERLRNEMQFKERDIAELQERCRRMEKQSRSASGDSSPCRSQFQSPGKSPRVVREVPSPRHPRLQTSPRTPQRTSTVESSGFPTRMSFMADEKKYSSPAKADRDKVMDGPRIASKLLGGTTHPPSDPVCNIKQSLISLLQNKTLSIDFGVQLERDASTMSFSTTLGNRSKGYLSNDSGSSRDSLQNHPVIQSEHIALAQQGICKLLTDSNSVTTSSDSVHHRNHSSGDITNLHANSGCIQLLPLIENYLQNYCELMQNLNESSYMSQSTGVSSDTQQSVNDSLTSSVKALVLENASCMNSVENQTLCALLVLEKLVRYSPHLRLVMVCEREFEQLIQEGRESVARNKLHPVLTAGLGVVSQKGVTEITHSANSSEQQQCEDVENDFHLNISDVLLELDNTCVKVLKHCDIVCKLMKLANPMEFNSKLGNLHLCEAALRILTVLAKSSTSTQLERFENIFTQEAASSCMKVYGDLSLTQQISLSCTALDLLTQLSRSAFLLTHLCSQEDDCLLLAVYNLCLYLLDLADTRHLRPLYSRVFNLMTSILMHHKNGGSKLLESTCSCNFEVVRVVSVCLHKELTCYRSSPHRLRLASLRKGFSVLHALSLRDKLFTRHHAQECRHQYVELVCSFENILKNIPGVEDSELNQVYELWDFDQDYPDSPEDEDMVEEESTPHPYGQQSGFSTSDRGQTVQGPSASQAIDVVMLDGD